MAGKTQVTSVVGWKILLDNPSNPNKPVIINTADFISSLGLSGDYLPLDGSGSMTGVFVPRGFVAISGDGNTGQTVDLYAANSNNIIFSGNPSDEIISFGTAPAGTEIYFRIKASGPGSPGGSLIVNSTDIITLDGLDTYTTPNDIYVFKSYGSGVWKETQRILSGAGFVHTNGAEGFLAESTSGAYTDWSVGGGDNVVRVSQTDDSVKITTANQGSFLWNDVTAPNVTKFAFQSGAILSYNNLTDFFNFATSTGLGVQIDGANDKFYVTTNNGSTFTIDGSIDYFEMISGAGNQFYIDGVTDEVFIASVTGNGLNASAASIAIFAATEKHVLVQGLGTFADNAAAVVGGVPVNGLYKTAAGDLRIVV